MPAYPVGMALLARLAVDQPQQGRGVGAMLLAEARREAEAGREIAAYARWPPVFLVDGRNRAAYWYHRISGFTDPSDDSTAAG